MLNFNHLYYFFVAAKLSGVTAAAKHLNTSQPSLSAQIKQLETSLGRKLFRKNGRRIELTEDGQQIYAYCKQIFELTEEIEHYARGTDELKRLRVSIGVSPEVERPFIANVIGATAKKSFEKARPVVTMLSLSEEDLRKSLKFNKIDILISDAPVYDVDLEVRATYSMPVVFFLSPELAEELKIKTKDSVTDALKKAANHLALAISSLRLRQESDIFLQKKKIKFNLVFESDILASIIRAVIDGMAGGLLPLPYILKEYRQGLVKIVSPAEGLWQHKIYVITRKSGPENVFLDNLLSILDSESKAISRINL